MMLSAANSSVSTSNEKNGLLNNNSLNAFKTNLSADSSASQNLRSQVSLYREVKPRGSLSNACNMNTPNTTPSSTIDSLESMGRLEQNEEVSNDKGINPGEGSTKVAGTWCPPIQALSSQTASLLSEINGKKCTKIIREGKDVTSAIRTDNIVRIPIERVVRAPCVKLEPQMSSIPSMFPQAQNVKLSNGATSEIKSPPIIKEEDSPASTNQKDVRPVTVFSVNKTNVGSSTMQLNNFVSAMNVSVPSTPEVSKQTTCFLAMNPLNQKLQLDATPSANETSFENDKLAHSPTPTDGTTPARKPCNCTKSSCLKLYCECFAQGITCSNCNCTNCMNNEQHEEERSRSIKMILVRNPAAFQSKIERNYGHVKGCNCKKSNCLKNYCECYEAKMACTSLCRCLHCKNTDHSQAMEIVRRSVYDKIMNKDNPIGNFNSPSNSGSVPESATEPNVLQFSHLQRNVGKPLISELSVDVSAVGQHAEPSNSTRSKSRFSDSVHSVVTTPVSPMDQKDKTLTIRTDEPLSPRSRSLKRMRSSGNSAQRNITPTLSTPGISTDAASRTPEELASSKALKPQEGMVNLTQTINEVVAASVRSESRRQKTVPCSSSLSLPIAKRARMSVSAESVTSGPSSCGSSNHFQLPMSDDVSSDTSGPREDEFTAEEIAMMRGIRERKSNATDLLKDGANFPSAGFHVNDESSPRICEAENDTMDVRDHCHTVGALDAGDKTAVNPDNIATSATSSEQQEDGNCRQNLVVLPDQEAPNILSFLQTSQLQIESALSGTGAGIMGGSTVPVPASAANASNGSRGKLLYSILSPNNTIGLVSLRGNVHRAATTLRSLPVVSTPSTASIPSVNNGNNNNNGNSGGVVHWRPQQQLTVPTSLPVSQQHQSSLSQQQSSPPTSPDVAIVQSATLSQLSDLVDGENGLRAQVTALERQVSEMRRSQVHQTRMLTAIHRALIRRQSHQLIGSNRSGSALSSGATSTALQRRRRLRWRSSRDDPKNS